MTFMTNENTTLAITEDGGHATVVSAIVNN